MRSLATPGRSGRMHHDLVCRSRSRIRPCVALHASASGAPGPSGGNSGLPIIRAMKLPNQADSVFNPKDSRDLRSAVLDAPTKSVSDLDYLSELLAIQQSDGPKNLGFFGTRNMGVTHQKLVEILAYAYASTGNHIFTSGATGTNAAVIKGALRANCPDKLTVLLPQSLSKQPYESQELLSQVANLQEMPQNDHLPLMEASRICNRKIISHIQQVVCFAFHDSRLLLETCQEAKEMKKIVTLFYLD
eukprot:XP_001695950.1 predicted protein [Chlamydomonas reinhardtii]